MSAIVQRFIREDLPQERGWSLIEWCLKRQGEEFSLQFMCLDGEPPTLHTQLRNDLTPFQRGTPKREHLTTLAGEEPRRATDTWSLCADSLVALRHHVSDGLFTAPSYTATGWFEDFTIYRQGEIMLGVVSHEQLIGLRLTEREHREFSELKIESHETAT